MSTFSNQIADQNAFNNMSLDLSAASFIDALFTVKLRQNLNEAALTAKADAAYTWGK